MYNLDWDKSRSVGHTEIQLSGWGLVFRAPIKPKYKPRNIEKINSNFTDQTSNTECIEFYRLAFARGPRVPMGTTAQVALSSSSPTFNRLPSKPSENLAPSLEIETKILVVWRSSKGNPWSASVNEVRRNVNQSSNGGKLGTNRQIDLLFMVSPLNDVHLENWEMV